MSNVSDVYDAIATRIDTILPATDGYMRLYNSYELEKNPAGVLRLGWGLAVGSGANSQRELSCRISVRRNFIISLTRKVVAIDNDAPAKAEVDKLFLEDHVKLLQDLCQNSSLPPSLCNINYASDSGVERIVTGKENFLSFQVTYEVEYFEVC